MISEIELSALLSKSKYTKQKEYWLNILGDEVSTFTFPYDYVDFEFKESKQDIIKFELDKDLVFQILKLSGKSELDIYTVLLSAIKVLIFNLSGVEDNIIGSPIYVLKIDKDTLNQIVYIKSKITSDMTFKKCLIDVSKSVSEAYENQDYPLDKILEQLNISDEFRSSLFNIVCLLENIHNKNQIKNMKYNIVFSFSLIEDRILCKVSFNECFYSKETVEAIINLFKRTLNWFIFDINKKLNSYKNLSDQEINQIVNVFNNTEAEYPRNKTIMDLIEEQVEKTPDRIAILFQGKELTYRALNEKANRLARTLRNQGVSVDSIVGVMVERSFEMIVAIMGILKAGGAYLPISPQCPEDRVHYMLKDSSV